MFPKRFPTFLNKRSQAFRILSFIFSKIASGGGTEFLDTTPGSHDMGSLDRSSHQATVFLGML
jgi:hypothetical protein